MKKIELLAPAGDLEKLKIAVLYGADAVFIGGQEFSLRARASNFSLADIAEGCAFAHAHNAKVHVTTNIIPHNENLSNLNEYLCSLEQAGVDAVICASPTIIAAALLTKMEVHVSTQQSIANSEAIAFWADKGVKRVVLAREVTMQEMKEIRAKTIIDLEAFIHGGMCVSYSGRCMLSNVLTDRDANRGGCAHSCRWNYDVYDNDEKLNKKGYFAMSSKDLCAVNEIKSLIDLGINSLKIEGRMKSIHYIASVVRTYRMLIDAYYQGNEVDLSYYANEIKKAENRQTAAGFLNGQTTVNEQLYDLRNEIPTKEFVGIVLAPGELATVEQRNFFAPGDTLELFGPKKSTIFTVENIYDTDGNILDAARHPRQILRIKLPKNAQVYDMLRLVRQEDGHDN